MKTFSTHEMVKILNDKALPPASSKFIERMKQLDSMNQLTSIEEADINNLLDLFEIYHPASQS